MRQDIYKNYLLVILLVIYAFNWQDRLALGMVLQNIKVELSLSDTQLGVLTGIAFALFYSLMGIPLARWADRGNRVTLIALTVALWSLMVALCGVAASFVQLLLIRMGVAVGEAGCMPAAHSLIPDFFTRAERPRAVAIFLMGSSLSFVTGSFLAGWLNERYGWRVMFMLLGLPGLGLAALTWFTLREPRHNKRALDAIGRPAPLCRPRVTVSSVSPSLHEVCVRLWGNITFRHMLFNFAVNAFFLNGTFQWQPAFFIRSYGLQTGELGTWFTLIYGLGGLVGTYLGGYLACRYATHNERLQLRAMTVVYIGQGVLASFIYLSHNRYLGFGLMGVICLTGTATVAPQFAMIQSLVPERMRAMSIALIYLCANLIGLGLGPLSVGALSDAFRSWAGEESLRYALLLLCPGYFWAAWHLWRGSKTVMGDLAAVHGGGQVAALESVAGIEPYPNHSL
jgi:predicted MFS family arabinose efflux permease